MSARLVAFTPELGALADGCQEAPRADEPYRRALRVIRGRLTSTAAEILDQQPQDGLDLGLPPYSTPDELRADLDTIDVSLRTHGSALLADDRLALLREGVSVFGFHLSSLDMRQNSDVHEEVISELLAWAGVHPDYSSLPEDDRVELLTGELSTRRPLLADRGEPVRPGAPRARRRRGRGPRRQGLRSRGGAQLRHLDVPVGVGCPGGRDPAQRGRPAGRVRAGTLLPRGHLAALRDHRRPAQRGRDSARDAGASALPGARGRPRRIPGSDAGLLRLQQGRWVSDRQLGGVPGRAGPGRSRPRDRESGCGSSTVAAAWSVAAAAPATRPSWRNRRER